MLNGAKDSKSNQRVKLRKDLLDPDPVIHEIPIFYSNSLSKQLFMLQVEIINYILIKKICYICESETTFFWQYPVRPSAMPYNSSCVKAARFKPNQKQVEIEFSLETRSNNFNKSKVTARFGTCFLVSESIKMGS